MIQPGVSEIDICLDLEFFIRRQGADIAFPSIVVSGNRSARPHGKPSEKKLEVGDFVTMDFGARVKGYNSDITRTVVVGEATQRHRDVYDAVLETQLGAIDAIRSGAMAKDVDAGSRACLGKYDLAKYFGHGLGHGLGLIVHDGGRLSASSDNVIAPGQIWTIEPGVYIEGFGGVRIEDDVLITEDGVEVLTHSPKEMMILPMA
jgi:Xaa-Pro aminopeptidase